MIFILISAFNADEWIADTLKSSIEQTRGRKESIAADDGSSDQLNR
jgi:glycosyltransferase involved in cell wall biosynthesis